MIRLSQRIGFLVLLAIVAALVTTTWPTFDGDHLAGQTLRWHMLLGGAMVVALVGCAIVSLPSFLALRREGTLEHIGLLGVLLSGWLTIVTIFLCMLPIASTELLRELIRWHGYAGFAMAFAFLPLLLSWLRKG